MENNGIPIGEIINQRKIGRYQWMIFILCGLSMILDGFDVQAIAYVAPTLLKEWSINKEALGPVFGAGLFGLLIGSLVFSFVADRVGRRPILIGTTFIFGLCMTLTTFASDLNQLIAIRFVTGLALGAVMPNAMALCGEYSPLNKRVSIMMFISCGFTVGALLGGFLAAYLIPAFGWQSIFIVGGVPPMIVALVMMVRLPESLQFLAFRRDKEDEIKSILHRLYPNDSSVLSQRYSIPDAAQAKQPITALFTEGRALGTTMLWTISFFNLIGLYFLSNWLPTLSASIGFNSETAVLVGATFQLGGTIGTLTMGKLIDRKGFAAILIPCFIIVAVSTSLIGFSAQYPTWLFVLVFISGFGIVGGQPAINALAASFYPTSLRTTGVGWSLGIGRIGSVIGPVVGGELLRLQWGFDSLFMVVAVPSVIIVLILVLGRSIMRKAT